MLVPRVDALFIPPFAPLWGAAGDHFIVPRTPFRMATVAIHIRPSSKAGLCPICSALRLTERKASSKRNKGNPGGVVGRNEKEIHLIYNGRSIHSYAQTSKRRLRLRPEAMERRSMLRLSGWGHIPGRLRASIALPGFGYQMSGLERPQWNGDKNKNKKDQAENREPLPSGIKRRNLIPRTGIGTPHQEN